MSLKEVMQVEIICMESFFFIRARMKLKDPSRICQRKGVESMTERGQDLINLVILFVLDSYSKSPMLEKIWGTSTIDSFDLFL